MATALLTRTLLGRRFFLSSTSFSHKPQNFYSFFSKRPFHSRPEPAYLAYRTSGLAPCVTASSIVGSRADFSTQSVSTNEPVVSVDLLYANLREPGIKVLDASWYMSDEQRNPLQEYQVKKNIEDQTYQHIDARSKARFDGAVPEPRKGIRSGHVPGSKCIPFAQVCRIYSTVTVLSPINETLEEKVVGEVESKPKDSTDVFRRWGCTDTDILKIFHRGPSLSKADVNHLQFKLNILGGLGITSTGLVKIINCRPRFLSCRINHCFDERIEFLLGLFGSRELLLKAIIRNPSLLTYDFHNRVKPVVALYERMGVSREELIPMLLSRPTLIPRSSLNENKIEYIRKTGISNDSKMYKYVVTLIAISRINTIREKVANLEKFGFSEDEVLGLFARSPLVLTLSVDKVQRNMTFVVGTLKLPASVVLQYPFLLYCNLEAVLKPRAILAGKIQEMGLNTQFKGPTIFTALRMTEKRFLKAFVKCHPKDVADELNEFYRNAKGVKRLAVASKKNLYKGFPF